jgi:hypothetical protein
MSSELNFVTDWLLKASAKIDSIYFQLPVAGQNELEYRERVYCYELYHQWRTKWEVGFPFTLGGEVDKQGHPLIRENPKPDFLVHIPGIMINLLAVEVKSKNTDTSQIIADLEKLTYFRKYLKDQFNQPANYEAAYFWMYGVSQMDWEHLRERILIQTENNHKVDFSVLNVYIHEQPGQSGKEVSWKG